MAKNKGIGKNLVIVGLVIAVLILGYLMLMPKTSEQPINKIADIPATDKQGVCAAREGVEVGMCCTKLNYIGQEIPVDCEELVAKVPAAQAFFQLGSGTQLANLPSVYFLVRAKNSGNFDTRVRVGSVSVTALSGGDAEGIARIKNGFETLKSQGWKIAAKGQTVDFGMTFNDRILIDVPGTYQMADGVYQVIITTEAEDPSLVPVPAGQTTIQLKIEQEIIAFNVNVEQTA